MPLPKTYKECSSPLCEGVYRVAESGTRQLCRRCREAEIVREMRAGCGEPPVEKAGGGYRVVRDADIRGGSNSRRSSI